MGTSQAGFQGPSSTATVGLDSSFQGAPKPPVLQPVPVYSSVGSADQHREPISRSVTGSTTGPVSHPQSFQHTFANQVASSITTVFQTLQPPYQTTQPTQIAFSKHPTFVLSASPTAAPSTQASSWDTAPPQTGDQGTGFRSGNFI